MRTSESIYFAIAATRLVDVKSAAVQREGELSSLISNSTTPDAQRGGL